MVTVLALLVQGSKVRFDDPITKYIPRLAEIAKKRDAEGHETFDLCRSGRMVGNHGRRAGKSLGRCREIA